MQNVALIIPCHNEEKTITKVVKDFRKWLPAARVVVVDNCSSDDTPKLAKAEGAEVIFEPKLGKGNAVRTAFGRIDADVYVLVDGDDTYPAEEIGKLLEPVNAGEADMTVGSRLEQLDRNSLKLINNVGNRAIVYLINLFFRTKLKDALSGYRVLTREFVDNVPLFSQGFQIETELTLQSLEKNYTIREIPVQYRPRHEESRSKLRPFNDGYKILLTIGSIIRDFKPMIFFPALSAVFMMFSIITGVPVIKEYIETHLIYRIPSAILASSLFILSLLLLTAGLIIQTVNKRFDELYFLLKKKR